MKNIIIKAIFTTLAIFALTLCCVGCQSKEDKLFEPNITYESFGAVGDGRTDDFEAIRNAHEYANENGIAVKANDKATYYIAAHEKTVTVKTNTDWGKAKFIVDDRTETHDGQEWWYPLFDVRPDKAPFDVTLPDGFSLKAGQQSIGLTFDEPFLLRIVNENKKDFVRRGNNQDSGDSRQEVILIDKNGNVDPSTPVCSDFDKVTLMTAYPVEETPIMLRGGNFTTVANNAPGIIHYYNRGIDVRRSNVTLKGISHFVTGEGETGSPYNGFFRTNYANNVTMEKCVMSGHKTYVNGNGVSQGTYDTRLNCSNDIKYIGCTQANEITDTSLWGIMCSDYCKNVLMDGCRLSRFDAHKGVYNATIKNSVIGQNVSVVGGGTLLMENTVRISPENSSGLNRFITLRYDYGSFWNGDIIIKDCTLETHRNLNYVIDANWANWDYGFPCAFPRTVTLDNVEIKYLEDIDYRRNYVFSFITEIEGETPAFAAASKNPVAVTEKIIVKNEKTVFDKTANKFGWFDDTPIIKD